MTSTLPPQAPLPLSSPARRQQRSRSISGNLGWPIGAPALYGSSPLPSPTFNRRLSGTWGSAGIIGSPTGQAGSGFPFPDNSIPAFTTTRAVSSLPSTPSVPNPPSTNTNPPLQRAKTLPSVHFNTPLPSPLPSYPNIRPSAGTSPTHTTGRSFFGSTTPTPKSRTDNPKSRFEAVRLQAAVPDRPASPMTNAILTGQFLD